MRHVEKDFENPPHQLKAYAQKYSKLFLAGKEDNVLKSKGYKLAAKALEKIYHNKCAYCEITIDESFVRIDHYRPKSIYPWLSFEWSNLVASCEICNNNKGSQFPLPKGTPAEVKGIPNSEESLAISKKLQNENPLLLHPEMDYPEQHLFFELDGSIKEKNGSQRGAVTIAVCGLNRDKLRRVRKLQIDGIFESILFWTNKIICVIERYPVEYFNDEIFWLSCYKKTFDELVKMQICEEAHTFTLLGINMYESFEYFFIDTLPGNEDIKNIVRKALTFFKDGKLITNNIPVSDNV